MGELGKIYTMDVTTLDESEREMRSLQIEGNRKRAERARQATMSMDPGIDLVTNISDLLGNLLHTCDVGGAELQGAPWLGGVSLRGRDRGRSRRVDGMMDADNVVRQRTVEMVCSRCQGAQWLPDPIIPLTGDGRVAGPPIPLELPYTCHRCRAVLAGQRATDPLVRPERRAQLSAAGQVRRIATTRDSDGGSSHANIRTRGETAGATPDRVL